jgi:hypothetical protein
MPSRHREAHTPSVIARSPAKAGDEAISGTAMRLPRFARNDKKEFVELLELIGFVEIATLGSQ